MPKLDREVGRAGSGTNMYEDIIKVAWGKVAKWAEHMRHHPIEDIRGVLEPLRHHEPFP